MSKQQNSQPTDDSNEQDCSRLLTQEQKESAKIFLIDDEPIILEIFSVYLAEAGFSNIFAFSDSVEAIETLRFVTPSIILTDINMPEVSGKFLIKLIRTFEHLRTIPIVAVTSNTEEAEQEAIIRNGADSIVHKPVDAKKLTDAVLLTLEGSFRLKNQITEAEQREQHRMEQKKAALISFESNLRDLMR
ncbi:response regulator [Mariniblastus fucicola]|uniref:Polar-differentiation response regulator DivK n=1 Tax=Mariniblastus fucicola TaxID=980251 RepID=A0A5B9P675_9BACT|nr:response regulator [Mariniblastus fucicola]QEG21774.1 Polar-differentiation response regulator DivK [Mariniblastus fucicola]